jgi:hypothetical protein
MKIVVAFLMIGLALVIAEDSEYSESDSSEKIQASSICVNDDSIIKLGSWREFLLKP